MNKVICVLAFGLAALFPAQAAQSSEPKLDHAQVENIVKRSYQYVAMYNVINKTAMAPDSSPMGTGGWNKLKRSITLFDASIKTIARPEQRYALPDRRARPAR